MQSVVLVKKLHITTEKAFFMQKNEQKKPNKRNKTKGISDYLYITHVESQILNRDPVFYYTGECSLKVLFEKRQTRDGREQKKIFNVPRSLLKLRSSWLPWIIFSLWKYWGIRVGYDRMYIIILPPLLSFRHTIIEDSEFIKRRLYENTKNSARNYSV